MKKNNGRYKNSKDRRFAFYCSFISCLYKNNQNLYFYMFQNLNIFTVIIKNYPYMSVTFWKY